MKELALCLAALLTAACACAPAGGPAPSPTTPTRVEPATPTVSPVPTETAPALAEVEGLVMSEDGQLIIGEDWLSRSRVTYRVAGGDVERLREYVGETVSVSGEVVEHSPWLKEITVRRIQAPRLPKGLSRRVGYIKEAGISIYMQGTHVLVDRDGQSICLLGSVEGGPDLDSYMLGKVAVIGVMEKTVEGNAQIMRVGSVEPAK